MFVVDPPGGALAQEEAAVSLGHERTVPDVVRQRAGPAPEPLAARGPEPAAGPRDQPGPDHCPHPNPRTGRDHEVDPSRQSAEDGDGRSVAGASSASVWAGLNRPVRGIVESWVRAKANSCLAGASGRSAGWPVAWARSRPSGQGVRRCGHVARSAPRGSPEGAMACPLDEALPGTQRHPPHPALQHQTPPVTAHQFLHHVRSPGVRE